jgi:hypothetical protein
VRIVCGGCGKELGTKFCKPEDGGKPRYEPCADCIASGRVVVVRDATLKGDSR